MSAATRSKSAGIAALALMLLAFSGISGIANAQDLATRDLDAATASFREGNAAYERGEFEAAAEAYRRAAELGAADARLHYNHGNALFRLGKLGSAILEYERARKLAPSDADVLHNLRFARSRVTDRVPEPQGNALTRALWALHSSYSLRTGIWAAWAFFAAGFAAFAVALFASGTLRAAWVTAGMISFAALLFVSPSLVYKVNRFETVSLAVVLEPEARLYSGPGEQYELLFRVHEGTSFTIESRHGEWLSVKLPDGRGGFIRHDKIGEV